MLDDLLARGDAAFLDELDVLADPRRLKKLARSWPLDQGPARTLLLSYLHRPLNPFHEPLVVRLFRRAGRAGDDELMGLFFVLFDRSLEPHQRPGGKRVLRPALMKRGRAIGDAYIVTVSQGAGPKPWVRVLHLTPSQRRDYEAYRLFAVPTRLLLRKGAWSYFNRLAREHPERYVPAMKEVLLRYVDEDIKDEPALLSRWGLLKVLFFHSDCIEPSRRGSVWRGIDGWRWLYNNLPPAPAHEALWQERPETLLDLAAEAPCRVVSLWAGRLLRKQPSEVLARLGHFQAIIGPAQAVASVLLRGGGFKEVSVQTWLDLLKARGEWALQPVLDLCGQYLPPEKVTLEQAVDLACSESPVAARRGWETYVEHHLNQGSAEPGVLLRLLHAPDASLRWVMASRVRHWLAAVEVPARWIHAFTDSHHEDVRNEGRQWLVADHRLRDPGVWRRLVRSPFRDVRGCVLELLDSCQRDQPMTLSDALPLTPAGVLALWARVLLTVFGSRRRQMPVLVRQLVERLEWRPADGESLVPMLAEVLQGSQGATWATALAGVVRLAELHPEWEAILAREAPELALNPVEAVNIPF
jgi:hypothetical protein